jgi:hypothetical protein
MLVARRCLSALLILASPAAAQTARSEHPAPAAAPDTDATTHEMPLLFGVAGGALSYQGGRQEQALGAVVRWVATPWLSLSTTPTMARVREPSAVAPGTLQSSSGMVDLPIDATLSHGFHAPWSPGVALGLGVSLPLGDTATGFGAGAAGYSASAGLGFSPSERVWVHLGAGRSLSDVSMQSAFTNGNGWGDASAGVSVTERFSVNGGYSTDLGAVDSTTGHSTSLNGGFSFDVKGPTTLNVNASHGLGGLAPRWSFALGLGTAFPYLNHLGAGSPIDQLRETFAGGTHGLGNGNGTGTGGTTNPGSSSGRGKGRTKL